MAESNQPESKKQEVDLSALLNRRKEQQIEQEFQDKLTDIRFRPLAAKAEKHQAKIDKQKKKAAKLTDKINKGNQKINKWKAKIADAQKTQAYCEQLLATHSLPKPLQMFFQGMLDRQKGKIERCQEKIKQKQEKIKKFTNKRTKCQKKMAKRQAKIDKIAGIDRFITNMGTAQGRRENFVQVLTGMRKSSLDKKNKKVVSIANKIAQKELALSKATTETEKVKLQQQIDKLKEQKDKLEGKINRLEAMAEKLDAFAAMSEQDLEKLITATTEGAKTAIEYDDYDLDDVFVVEADKAFGNQQNEPEQQTEQEPEQQTEQEPEQQTEQEPEQQTEQEPEQQTEQEPEQQTEQEPEQQTEQEPEQQTEQEPEQQTEQEPEQQTEQEPEQQTEQESEQQTEPKPKQQTKQNQTQQGEHGTAQKAAQGNGQTAGAGKQSDLVKFSGLSGTHIQALKDSNITFWVKKESENTFSAFVHRSDAEQAKGILSSVSQAQKKTASSVRQTHRKM